MSHRAASVVRITALSIGVTLLAAACSSGSHRDAGPAPASAAPVQHVLALGGGATEGDGIRDRLQQAWPYLVFHDAFPISTVFVNGALDGATVASALETQVPLAVELKPDVVEVWLGADDLAVATPVPDFTLGFTDVITRLRSAGSRRILVADLPEAYGGRVSDYNTAIHEVVTRTNAELVRLATARIALPRTEGSTPLLDEAGHRAVAAAFEKQLADHS
jgi:lysophospholipase L1-like esterase